MAQIISETIGCDLGDKRSSLFVVRADGSTERPPGIATTQEGMRKFFTRPPAHVVIENGTHSRWVSKLLKELGHQVTVANPRKVRLISQSSSKTDERDAEMLARLGRADTKLLSPIQHRTDGAQADLAVIRTRDALVRTRSKLVSQARGLVKSFGYRLPRCTAESFHRQTAEHVPVELKQALDPLYKVLSELATQIDQQEKAIEAMAVKYPEVKRLSQPAGVGILTAMTFLLTVEDKNRFAKSREIGPYLGLTPRRDQSGSVDKQLGITKAGDPHVRRLLVLAAQYILGPFGPDSDLRRHGRRMMSADSSKRSGGKRLKKRAVVAVARKLAVLMYRLWVTGEEYDPLHNSKKKEPSMKAA